MSGRWEMTINLKVYATLVQKLSDDFKDQFPGGLKAGTIVKLDMPDGSDVHKLFQRLELSEKNGLLTFVNGRAQHRDYMLKEGDEIGLFPPIGGG
jgi:molybdopterin converting factor small subunit